MLKIVFVSALTGWDISVKETTHAYFSDVYILCDFIHILYWKFDEKDKIRVVFSNATNVTHTASSIYKSRRGTWEKDEEESLIVSDHRILENLMSFKFKYVKPTYTGSYWCEHVSKSSTVRSGPISLTFLGT